jgi:hypothetical protein
LAGALKTLLGDAALRAQMGQAGQAKVAAEFASATEAEKLKKILMQSKNDTA